MSERRTDGFSAIRILAGAGLLLAWTATAGVAQQADSRWLPFLGCWEAVGEMGAAVDESMLCVRPSLEAPGVEMLGVTETGRVTARETVRADGQRQEFTQEGCEGWQAGEFSGDASRVYLRSEQVCEGEVRRTSSGVLSMVTPYEWVDVQEVSIEDEGSTWSMRYRLVSDERAEAAGFGDVLEGREMAVRSARIAAARNPDVDDVIEVHDHVGPGAAQAWAVESGSRFDLDAEEVVRLADAGVPGDVIDVVVAVSYPSRFALDRDARVTEVQPDAGEDYADRHPYGTYYDPYRWDPFYYGYGRFGYNRLGYSPWGARSGYYGGFYRPVVVRVEPRQDGPRGRVVDGRGWIPGGSGDSGGRAVRRSGGGSTGAAAGSSTGTSTSRGSAGSSRGSSTGRRAKRRGGGGGGGGLM